MKNFMSILSLLIVSATLTFSFNAQSQETEDPIAKLENRIAETKKRLNLTPEQEEQLTPIIEKSMDERLALLEKHGFKRDQGAERKRPSFSQMRALRSDMQELNEQTRESLAKILTEDQLEEWDDIQEENRAQMRERIRNRR